MDCGGGGGGGGGGEGGEGGEGEEEEKEEKDGDGEEVGEERGRGNRRMSIHNSARSRTILENILLITHMIKKLNLFGKYHSKTNTHLTNNLRKVGFACAPSIARSSVAMFASHSLVTASNSSAICERPDVMVGSDGREIE